MDVQGAYGLSSLSLSNTTGSGITVAIVDAFGDTTSGLSDQIQSDLQTFCTNTNLPYNGPSSGNPTLTEAFPDGSPASSDSNWATETALDVEWVHAMAPGAKILLVVTPDAAGTLYDGVVYAASHAPIVSMSWGGAEFSGETSLDSDFTGSNVAFFASTGDNGTAGGVAYPSSSPNVTAVGGTSLTIDSSYNWVAETGWSGSGGGTSGYEPNASFQSSWVSSGNREVPDIAALADPNTGVMVVQGGSEYQVGGTSLACPLWAGFTAILDANLSHPIDEATLHSDLYLYGNSSNLSTNFHDITSGSNGGFSCATGYDEVTGIGAPIVNVLLSSIVNGIAPTITSATSATGTVNTSFSYQITATNNPTSYNATGLPTGLTINTSSGLISGTPTSTGTSTVSLSATNAAGTGTASLSLTISAASPPSAPSGLTATPGNTSVSLSWSAVSGATSYNVYRSTVSGSSFSSIASNVASTSYSDSGLTNGTTYYYEVTAVNANGESADSAQVSATPQLSAPAAPASLTALAGNGTVSLSWSSSTGATGYNVLRATVSGGPYSAVASNLLGTSYTDSSVTNGTTYYYVVNASNAGGTGSNSNEAVATPYLPAPGAPTNLIATGGNAQVVLTWNGVSGATGYNVKRLDGNGLWVTLAAVGATTYTDTNVTNGTAYTYCVSALNSTGESADSSTATATPRTTTPSTPTGVTGGTGPSGTLFAALSWSAVSGATSYNVYRSTTSGGPYTLIVNVLATQYNDGSVSSNTTYYYVITAVNSAGESGYSSEVSVTMPVTTSHGVAFAVSPAQAATVYYGTNSGSLTLTKTDSTVTTIHRVTLTGLSTGTTYYWKYQYVKNGVTTYSAVYSFNT